MKVFSGWHPVSKGDINRRISKFINTNLWGRLLNDIGERHQRFCNNGNGLFGVIAVTYANGRFYNSLIFRVPENFSNDMSIGDSDPDTIFGDQGRIGEPDVANNTINIFDGDGVTENKGPSEDDDKAGTIIR